MAQVTKISEAASLALHATVILAREANRLVSTQEISQELKVSHAHLSKVLQRLARAGLVRASRGPHGGFSLDRPVEKTSLLDIYEAIEGPIETSNCLYDTGFCGRKHCIFGEMLSDVNQLVRNRLAGTTLPEVIEVVRSK